MKKSINYILLLVAAGILLQCRKGKDDPRFSIHTRKARVVGEWTMTSGTASGNTTSYSGASLSSYSDIYTENSYSSFYGTNSSSSGTFSYKIEFKKDGSFSSTE